MKKINDDWSCIGSESISPYAEVCLESVNDDNVFKNFKSDPRYIAITENVPIENGKIYAEDIQAYDIDADLISAFKENDLYGGANIVNYGEPFGLISPSTLRYIQNALDISYFFGEGELNKICLSLIHI